MSSFRSSHSRGVGITRSGHRHRSPRSRIGGNTHEPPGGTTRSSPSSSVREIGAHLIHHGGLECLPLATDLLQLPEDIRSSVQLLRNALTPVRLSVPLLRDEWYDFLHGAWRIVEQALQYPTWRERPLELAAQLKEFYAEQGGGADDLSQNSQKSPSELPGIGNAGHGEKFSALQLNGVPSMPPHALIAVDMNMLEEGPQGREVTSPDEQQVHPHVDGKRTAPEGHIYKCPSRRCKQSYVKLGHYEKHIEKNHPDFARANPNYVHHPVLKSATVKAEVDSRYPHDHNDARSRLRRLTPRTERVVPRPTGSGQHALPASAMEATLLGVPLSWSSTIHQNPGPHGMQVYDLAADMTDLGGGHAFPQANMTNSAPLWEQHGRLDFSTPSGQLGMPGWMHKLDSEEDI